MSSEENTCGQADIADYHGSMHVWALLSILAISLFGSLLPVIASKHPALRLPPTLFKAGRCFGTGVILGTTFIHMIPSAVLSLNDPCLSTFWNDDYTAWAGLFALFAAFLVQATEFISTTVFESHKKKLSRKRAARAKAQLEAGAHPEQTKGKLEEQYGIHDHAHNCHAQASCGHEHDHEDPTEESLVSASGNAVADKPAAAAQVNNKDLCELLVVQTAAHDTQPNTPAAQPQTDKDNQQGQVVNAQNTQHLHAQPGDNHGEYKASKFSGKLLSAEITEDERMQLITSILEVGVAFHSVVIGLTLGAMGGSEFTTLWVALIFHQFFEGFALGVTLVDSNFKNIFIGFMVALYTLATPVGILIGMLIHSSYSETNTHALIIQGILDSVSGGVLLYTGLVELLSYQITNSPQFRQESRTVQTLCFCCMYVGAAVMAAIGYWA